MLNYFIGGMILGSIITKVIIKLTTKTLGVLKIDRSNPEKDDYLLMINDIDNLEGEKEILLKIVDDTRK